MDTRALNSSKTPGIIVTEIKMMGATFQGTHFLVEGEDDIKFWKPRLNRHNVSLLDCGGKTHLLGAAKRLEQAKIPAIAGVYDADFDRLANPPETPYFIFPTDANDLELTLLTSGAFEKLLIEHADPNMREAFENSIGITVSEHIEQTSLAFGRLRFINQRAGHQVNFKHFSPYRFVSKTDWSLNIGSLHCEYAKQAALHETDLQNAIAYYCPSAPAWAYSQGHDALCILARGLSHIIGRMQIDEPTLARSLRLAYEDSMLQQTAMYASLCGLQPSLPSPLFV